MISSITLSVMNNIDKKSTVNGLINAKLKTISEVTDGYNYFIEGILIKPDDAYMQVELFNLNSNTEDLIVKLKDQILEFMTTNINCEKVCVRTNLDNGFNKHDFYDSKVYNPPKKNWIVKLYDKLYG